jgi:hypothetical protein
MGPYITRPQNFIATALRASNAYGHIARTSEWTVFVNSNDAIVLGPEASSMLSENDQS